MSYLFIDIQRDGTSQTNRLIEAILPSYIGIEERSTADFLEFIYKLAQQIVYYNNKDVKQGNWQSFFKDFAQKNKIDEIIAGWKISGDAQPHISLVVAFLKLMEIAIGDLNNLTQEHLDFLFRKILKIEPKAAEADKVHVLFELSRTVDNYQIKQGTQLKAGKFPDGKDILYSTNKEYVLNKALISSVKSLFVDTYHDYLLYAAPVANSADGQGTPFVKGKEQWYAFGRNQKDLPDSAKTMQLTTTGFAVSSPLLLLSEGSRKISLQFEVLDISGSLTANNNISDIFKIYLSGEKEWIVPEIVSAKLTGASPTMQLNFEITLPEYQPSVIPYNSTLLGGAFNTEDPVVKILLNTENWEYTALSTLQAISLTIFVSVTGVKNLILQSDQGVQDPAKPFFPFGPSPRKGSKFYIGSSEIFQKKLDILEIQVNWANLPTNPDGFPGYYTGYTGSTYTNSGFHASISILDKRVWVPSISPVNFQFFDSELSGSLKINSPNQPINTNLLSINRDSNIDPIISYTGKENKGFLKLELDLPDFGHQEFPGLYTQKVLEKALDPSNSAITLPNPPYTPEIQDISLNYSSSQIVNFNASNGIEQFFYIEPFGEYESELNGTVYLLPQFTFQGNLFIGLVNFIPPSNINLLFQLAEGTGDPLQAIDSGEIQWSYLANNQWILFDSTEIISENTSGFQTSGIVELTIASDATNENTRLPFGMHWIKAQVIDKAEGANQIINIHTQAVETVRILDKSVTDPSLLLYNIPLPPLTISKLAVKDASVKSVLQPYNSFNGKPGEQDESYNTRVSERLRHKNRAINLWDYEHLVLENFPNIYKVKCLNHTSPISDKSLGSVTLIAIQSLLNENVSNPFEPKTSTITLTKIKEFIQQLTSPFVDLYVENPIYEKLLVHFKVGFYEGLDPGFYAKILQDDIKKFLSPWAYNEGEDIIIGGKVYKSVILAYIENREYVDYVNDFKLYHINSGPLHGGIGDMAIGVDFIVRPVNFPGVGQMILGDDFVVGEDVEIAVASDPKAILVSANEHFITVLKSGDYACVSVKYEGIGFMAVGVDFIVGKYPYAIGNAKIVPPERHSPLTITLPDDLIVSKIEDLINP